VNAPAAAVRALNCPNCGGPVTLRAAGYTVTLVCPHCGSTLDATDPDFTIIEQAAKALRRPEIALGTRGTLAGAEWEAVGYMERASADGGWSEYLLFNPYLGYRFLIDDGENFSLGELLDRVPEERDAGSVTLNERIYRETEALYEARVTFVVGEFYWRVRVGESVLVRDYAGPGGRSLSTEKNDQERSWTVISKLRAAEIANAFGVDRRPTRHAGVSPPAGGSADLDRLKQALRVAMYAIVGLIVASLFGCSSHDLLVQQNVTLDMDAPARTIVLGPIDMPRPLAGLTVKATSPELDNAWIDLDYSLVDRRTQQSYDAYKAAEYYHGRDSDGDWTEGNRSPAARFASIPRGSYDLVVEAAAHRWSGAPGYGYGGDRSSVTATIAVRRGASFAGNFWLALILILLWPAFLIWRLLRRAGSGGD
jgi:hypothetical protein